MSLNYIYEQMHEYFKKPYFESVLQKIWIYKSKTVVLDCYYNSFLFAYDVELDSDNKLTINFVDRSGKILKNDLKKIKLNFLDKNDSFLNFITTHIDNIKNELDNKYKYMVSLIVPVYNREKLIYDCLESINKQTLDKKIFEVIFVDDGSIDNTINTIDNFINSNINYKIIKRPIGSGNASAPRNEGIKAAQGKFIFFLDSDDTIHSDTLSDGLKCAQENNSDIVYFKMVSTHGRLVPIRPYKFGNVAKASIVKNHLMRSLAVFKFFNRELLISNKILFNPSISVAEDKVFMLECLCVSRNISILADKPYYCASLHEGEHLSRSKVEIDNMLYIVNLGFLTIYSSKRSNSYTQQLYNAWLIIALEQSIKLANLKNKNIEIKKMKFGLIYNISAIGFHLIKNEYIYSDLQKYLTAFKLCQFEKIIELSKLEHHSGVK